MKKVNFFAKKGVSTLILTIFLAFLFTTVVAVIQTRLLLTIYRQKSLSDTLITTYQAESEIHDMLIRLLSAFPGGPNIAAGIDQWITLADGTEVHIQGYESGGDQIVTIEVFREYATNVIQAVLTTSTTSAYDRAEIVLVLDCTGSMRYSADPTCIGACETRMTAQKKATLNFLQEINILPNDIRNMIHIGIVVFGVDAKWMLADDGTLVTPDSGFNLNEISTMIDDKFGTDRVTSSACTDLMDSTSIGSGLLKAQDYFDANYSPTTKQIEILITDGEPNARIPEPDCGGPEYDINGFCPTFGGWIENPSSPPYGPYCPPVGSNAYGWMCAPVVHYCATTDHSGNSVPDNCATECKPHARDFLRCTLADTNTIYAPAETDCNEGICTGIRNPEIDAYSVTIFDGVTPQIMDIFDNYSTEYYQKDNANDLSDVLEDILTLIVDSLDIISIQRLIPSPIP